MADSDEDPIRVAILNETDVFRELVIAGTSGFTMAHRQILSKAIQEHCRKLCQLDIILKRNLQGNEDANYKVNEILSSETLEVI